jgi:hypothetical protein
VKNDDNLNGKMFENSRPDIITVIKLRKTRWVGYVVCMAEMRNAYIILVGKPVGNRPRGKSR